MEGYVELHAHLDGAITCDIAGKLALLQGKTVPCGCDLEKMLTVPSDCSSLDDMLKCFAFPLSLLQTREGISNAVRLVLEDMAGHGVVYAEIRFAPALHTLEGLTTEDAVKAAIEGLKDSPIKANLILCAMRGSDNDKDNEHTLDLAAKYLVSDGGVVAFDLAGSEQQFPLEHYRWLFEKAVRLKVSFTIHAGEAAGSENVRLAIELGARRVGHGVRACDDPEVVELLKTSGVSLEMCPTSNRMTHAVDDMKDYPLKAFLENGIRVTVNTDDPAIEGICITDEFDYIRSMYGINDDQKRQIIINSVDAAFTTAEVKSELRRMLGF